MPDRRALLVLIAGLTLASPSLLDAVAHRLRLCLPDTWAQATMIGVSTGLIAFVAVMAWRAKLRCPLAITAGSIRTEIPAADA